MYKLALKLCILMTVQEFLVADAEPISPSECSDVFSHDSNNKAGSKEGTLTLISDYDLNGVWIRLIFDHNKFTLTTNMTDLIVQKMENANEVLLKNRDLLLKANIPMYVKIELMYDGSAVPNLIEYRLNAKTLCPSGNKSSKRLFKGDEEDKTFLAEIIRETKITALPKPTYKCGEIDPESESHSSPWHAAIYFSQNNKERYICEGTLISDKHILTAAHCVSYIGPNAKAIEPKLIRIQIAEDASSKKFFNVQKITIHPGFEIAGLLNDIAILHLDHSLEINSFVRPICLPATENESSEKVRKTILWGHEILNKSINTDKLTNIEVEEIRSISKCESRMNLENLQHLFRVSDNTYCAIYKSPTDTKNCAGDSGAAVTSLTLDNTDSSKQVHTLNGLVTVGVILQNTYDCNESSTIVLLDILNYLRWIFSVIYSE